MWVLCWLAGFASERRERNRLLVREKGRNDNRSQKTGRAGSKKNGSMARTMGCGGVLYDCLGETWTDVYSTQIRRWWHTKEVIPSMPSLENQCIYEGLLTGVQVTLGQPHPLVWWAHRKPVPLERHGQMVALLQQLFIYCFHNIGRILVCLVTSQLTDSQIPAR